ncbi:MAG: AI-2E family transporter [Anaerolineales bacterium]|nr:AI-2E family transporter [Anaerolineales bacterium]
MSEEEKQSFQLPKITSPPWQTGTRLLFAVLMAVVVGAIALRIRQVIGPLVLALLLAYLLHPLVIRVERWLPLPRGGAVLTVYGAVVILIVGATTGAGFAITQQIIGLVQDLTRLAVRLPAQLRELSESTVTFGPWVVDLSTVNLDPLVNSLISTVQPLLSRTGTILASAVGTTATTVGLMVLVMVMGYYLLRDFGELDDALLKLVPFEYRDDFARLLKDTGQVWNAFLRGQTILAVVMGVLTAALYGALGLRFALGLGLIAGVLEFVPIFGPIVAGILAVLVALFQSANWWGLSPLAFALVVAAIATLIQQVENSVLVPRIIGHSLNLHPLVVLVAAFAGGIIAGVLGVLLAAPTVATLRLWGGYIYRKTVGLDSWPSPVLEGAETPERINAWQRLRAALPFLGGEPTEEDSARPELREEDQASD